MKSPLIFTLLTLICCTQAFAQFPGAKGPKRYEIGYSYPIASATYKLHYTFFNEATGLLEDTSYSEHLHSKGGFGATVGLTWPVTALSDKSCLAIAAAYNYGATLWEPAVFNYSSNSQTGTVSSEGSGTIAMALPVGLDYKFGCDALGDKSERFCYTFGAGVNPELSLTVYKESAGGDFRVLPYLKGEVGVFAGICFKLRAMFTFGNIKYFDSRQVSDYSTYEESLKGKTSLKLSLIIMPFSWKFGKSAWWY